MTRNASDEFDFLRKRLESVGRLLITGDSKDLKQAIFMIGCMHTLCCVSVDAFEEKKSE